VIGKLQKEITLDTDAISAFRGEMQNMLKRGGRAKHPPGVGAQSDNHVEAKGSPTGGSTGGFGPSAGAEIGHDEGSRGRNA
jgi:hypothetical protein